MGRKGQEHVFALLEAAGRLNLVVLVTFFFFIPLLVFLRADPAGRGVPDTAL